MRGSDRWHDPATATGTAVSQRLLESMPVVETGLRVPGGQVVHRAWCVVADGGDWAVVEVENRSREPVGIALVLGGGRVAYADRLARVGGRLAMVLPREPSRFTSAPDDGGTERWPGDRRGRAPMGFVFPLAHTARLRVALPLAPGRGTAPVDATALPDADRVARGWRSHVEAPGTLRVELPDGAAESLAAERAEALLDHDDPPSLALLDRCGHHDVVRGALHERLAGLRTDRWAGAGPLLVVAAEHHRRTREPLPEELVGPVAEAAHKLRRRAAGDPWTAAGQQAAAELLEGAGQPEAAASCRSLAGEAAAVPVGWPETVLDRLLADTDAGVDLVPGLPDEWLGQGVEVHDAPTRFGPVSFALRWHGPRPALLWEASMSSTPSATLPVPLRAPRLDPSWSATERRGEALLAAVEPAGGLPKVVAPLAPGTAAGSAPEGGSFA